MKNLLIIFAIMLVIPLTMAITTGPSGTLGIDLIRHPAVTYGGNYSINTNYSSDSDKLDGQHGSYFYQASNPFNFINVTNLTNLAYAQYQFINNNFNGSGNFNTTGNATIKDLTITAPTSGEYKFLNAVPGGNRLGLQCQTSGQPTRVQFFSKDGDGTDNILFEFFAKGTPTNLSTDNIAWLQLGFNAVALEYQLRSVRGGSGTYYPVHLNAGVTNQFRLETDGTSSFGGQLTATDYYGDSISVTDGTISDTFRVNTGAVAYFGTIYSNASSIYYDGTNMYINPKSTGSGELRILGNLNVTGNVSMKRPYGLFSSTQDQTLALANTAYPVTFNWTEDSYLITKQGDSNFSVSQNGDYLIELSAVFQSAVANKKSHLWFQIWNGTAWNNVPRSNTEMTIRTLGSDYIVAVPYILDIHTNEKFRIMFAGNDNGIFLNYMTNTSYAPETPSILMTANKISEITP